VAKCHFRTTDAVLAATGASRAELGEFGAAVSRRADAEAADRVPTGTAAHAPSPEP
jgi:hypothetical protein